MLFEKSWYTNKEYKDKIIKYEILNDI